METLDVTSFETTKEGESLRGTVQGQYYTPDVLKDFAKSWLEACV
jgi:hypothetical protein